MFVHGEDGSCDEGGDWQLDPCQDYLRARDAADDAAFAARAATAGMHPALRVGMGD